MSIALAANNNVITESVYGNRFLFQGIVAAIPFPDPYKTYIALTEGIINAITLDDGFFEEQKGQ